MILYLALIDTPEAKKRFENLYTGYRKQMYFIAYRILEDPSLAEDAVENAFLGVALSMDRLPDGDGEQVKAYLFTCAKNAALSLQKKEEKQFAAAKASREHARFSPSAFEKVQADEEYERMVNCIRQLDEVYRDVLLFRYVYEMSPGEIATALGRKKDTVKKQLVRGKKLLLTIYEKEVAKDAEAIGI